MKKIITSLLLIFLYPIISNSQTPKVDSIVVTYDKYGNKYTTVYTSTELNTTDKNIPKTNAIKPKKVK